MGNKMSGYYDFFLDVVPDPQTWGDTQVTLNFFCNHFHLLFVLCEMLFLHLFPLKVPLPCEHFRFILL